MGAPAKNLTQLLKNYGKGKGEALEEIIPVVHSELKHLAQRHMMKERANHTLQPTALVNEAFLRLIDQKSIDWQDRRHFFGVASRLMRQILINHAKARIAQKRGGSGPRISFEENLHVPEMSDEQLVHLDEALALLAEKDERQSKVVELRFFGGLSIEETASALEISPATVKREWTIAKAWLFRQLTESE